MSGWTFQYKCRLCGKEFTEGVTNEKIASDILMAHSMGRYGPDQLDCLGKKLAAGLVPENITIHLCGQGQQGLGDLQGIVEQKS